jgi:hypothetical protein
LGGAQHRPTTFYIHFGRARAAARPILSTEPYVKKIAFPYASVEIDKSHLLLINQIPFREPARNTPAKG